MTCKEKINEFVNSKMKLSECVDKNILLDLITNYMPMKELLALHNELLDDKFKSIMENDDLKRCVEYFFDCELNVAETSRKSFLHRNTLLYRLDRIQSLTGLNIRNFDDAITFKILMLIYNLTK